MIIVTNVAGRVEHGPYSMTKQGFLNLKQGYQNEININDIKEVEKFLRKVPDLAEKEIYTMARFFIRTDFTIEE